MKRRLVQKSARTIIAFAFLTSWFSKASLASAAESQDASTQVQPKERTLVLTPPLTLSAGIECAVASNPGKAQGLTADMHIGPGLSSQSGANLLGHYQLGFFARTAYDQGIFLQYGVGAGAKAEFFRERLRIGLGAILKVGNDWKTASGYLIGFDWIGASLVVSKSESTILLRLPSLRVGLVL